MFLRYSVVFLVVALVAAVFGFTTIAVAAVAIARVLFFIFLMLFVLLLLAGLILRI